MGKGNRSPSSSLRRPEALNRNPELLQSIAGLKLAGITFRCLWTGNSCGTDQYLLVCAAATKDVSGRYFSSQSLLLQPSQRNRKAPSHVKYGYSGSADSWKAPSESHQSAQENSPYCRSWACHKTWQDLKQTGNDGSTASVCTECSNPEHLIPSTKSLCK